MPRVTKEPEERRQEILDTAMKLFYEKGYEKTSMTDIAGALHIAQGLCYRYFPSKEALFDAAIDQYAQTLVDRMAVILQKESLTLPQLVEQMPTFLEAEADDSYIDRLCHGPESRKIHQQLSLSVCAKMTPLVQALLEKAVLRGEIHLADPQAAASFCVYGQLGILLDQAVSPPERVRRIKAFLGALVQKF